MTATLTPSSGPRAAGPCDLPKLNKAINEVYHQYNRHQYPVVVLNVQLPSETVDVNVTPDKRTLFLHSIEALTADVKATLDALYAPFQGSYSLNNSIGEMQARSPCARTPRKTEIPYFVWCRPVGGNPAVATRDRPDRFVWRPDWWLGACCTANHAAVNLSSAAGSSAQSSGTATKPAANRLQTFLPDLMKR